MNFLNFPIIKRMVPSIRKNTRIIFKKHIFWANIDGISYLLDIRQKQDREFYFKKKYEQENFNFIYKNNFFSKPFIFVDIGCNIGIYTLIIGKKFKNCKHIFSFEPILESYNSLRSNIKKNTIENITSTFNFALSNKEGKAKMTSFKKKNQIQLTKFEINKKGDVDVQTKMFDNLYKFNNEYIFIKCDVEGHEYKIIEGMKNTLKRNNCLLQIEIFKKNFSDTEKILNDLGYIKIEAGNHKSMSFFFNKMGS